jgi:hypothetical protein
MHRAIGTAALLFGMVFAAGASAQSTTQPAEAGDGARVHETKDFAIAVPAAWSEMKALQNAKRPLHAPGDGKGVPMFDDTNAPLQVGMGVEHFEGFKMTLDECVKSQVESATNAPRLKQIGNTKKRSLKLSDGRDAVLLIFEFEKEGGRHSTQVKLITKGSGDDHWVASAWAVGSKDSKILGHDKPLVTWLVAHVETFVLDPKKFDREKLPPAFSAEK